MFLFKRKGILLILITLLNTSIVFSINVMSFFDSSNTEQNPLEKVDIGVNMHITEVETSFSRYFELTYIWDNLLLNMTVQNHGDSLENILISTETNGAFHQSVFSTYKDVGLIQAINHQFNLAQSILIPLNSSLSLSPFSLNLILILDHTISWRNPNIDFNIIKSEIIGINSTQLSDSYELYPLSVSRNYVIHESSFNLITKPLLIDSLFFLQSLPDYKIDGIASINLQGCDINYIRIDSDNHFINKGGEANISFFKTFPADGILYLEVLITPNYNDEQDDTLSIKIDLSFLSRILYDDHSFGFILGNHPIPEWIMFPIMLITLFGIPFYLVYQESLAIRNEEVIYTDQTKFSGGD